jgi:hypothetical protein
MNIPSMLNWTRLGHHPENPLCHPSFHSSSEVRLHGVAQSATACASIIIDGI